MQLIAWSIPGFIVLMAIEAAIARRRGRRIYRLSAAVSDLSCGITSQLCNIFTASLGVLAYVALYQLRLVELDPSAASTWLLAMLGVDFFYYWWHRLSHEVNLLWAAHVVHHHSEDLNLAVALRQALFTSITAIPFSVPMALLGVPPFVYFAARALNTLYQFWIHTELIDKLGPVERVLNTPSHHRVHHADQPPLPRQELRRHPHLLGPPVRHLRARGGAPGLRHRQAAAQPQPAVGQHPSLHRDRQGRGHRPDLARVVVHLDRPAGLAPRS
jgi:alkylglycerol monooxygenase